MKVRAGRRRRGGRLGRVGVDATGVDELLLERLLMSIRFGLPAARNEIALAVVPGDSEFDESSIMSTSQSSESKIISSLQSEMETSSSLDR